MSAVGGSAPPVVLGHWNIGPAWSTMKVPLVMAATLIGFWGGYPRYEGCDYSVR